MDRVSTASGVERWLAAKPDGSSGGVPTPTGAVFSAGGGTGGTGALEAVVAGATEDGGGEPAGDVGAPGDGVATDAAGGCGATVPDDAGSGATGVDCASAAVSSESAANTAKMEAILTTLMDTSGEPFSKRTSAFARSGARVVDPRELE